MSSTDSDGLGKVVGMTLEWVVGMARNEWTASIGIDGRHGPEHAAFLCEMLCETLCHKPRLSSNDQSKLLPSFLEWMSKTHNFTSLCQRASEGTTNRVRLQLDRFPTAEISLPPLDEQRRIVELATKVELAKKAHEAATTELDALQLSILDKAFKGEL